MNLRRTQDAGRRTITKAMLLAAGLGTRLRPLTDTAPKPMLPVRGRPLIDYALERLARGGIHEVMINVHHLAEQIERHVGDGARYSLRVHYSREPRILGTGGGVKQCAGFFGQESFVLMNADTLIDIDLATVIAAHRKTPAAGTMVVRALTAQDTYQPVTIDAAGYLTGFGHGTHYYAGVQICTTALLDILPSGRPACLIADGVKPLLVQGTRVATMLHTGQWNDVGTPERYAAAQHQGWL